MEEIADYKKEIVATRVGCLGSSDGHMLGQIAQLGYVPASAYKRMAIVKGFVPQEEIPETAAIKAGNDIEMAIFNNLYSVNPNYQSNPMFVSKKYSTPNCKLISHPDIVLKDDEHKVLKLYEVKTTKFTIEQTRATYSEQLYIHYLLGSEMARRYGNDWSAAVYLVHYSTNGLDIDGGVTFEPERMTIRQMRPTRASFDVKHAMEIVNEYLESMQDYSCGEEIDANMLPDNVKAQFSDIANVLVEIKERETKVNEFKERLYLFMLEKNIKSIKNDVFSISRVDPTESKTFDAKRYLDDEAKAHPRKVKKLVAKYTKTTKRKGYAVIKIKGRNGAVVEIHVIIPVAEIKMH